MSGDIFIVSPGGGATGTQRAEARDAAEHLTVPRTAPSQQRRASDPNGLVPGAWKL